MIAQRMAGVAARLRAAHHRGRGRRDGDRQAAGERAKGDFEAREGVKLTFLPFFALAAVEALKVHPKLNAVINGDMVTYHDAEHLGVAVDTERGLMVPVIHNAGDLNIGGLARKISDLAQRTRSGQVGPDELAGGTFTLTNTGSRGALFDTPIINQPQVAILGTGTVVKRPVVVEDASLGEVITVRSMVYLALTYDHRLVDGADAARFLNTVRASFYRKRAAPLRPSWGCNPHPEAGMKVAVTGSSGLIGSALVADLRSEGHQVIRLVRRSPHGRPTRCALGSESADAGLAARSPTALEGLERLRAPGRRRRRVASRRWTSRYKAEIRASRVLGTRALAGALAKLGSRPPRRCCPPRPSAGTGDTGGLSGQVPTSRPHRPGPVSSPVLVHDWEEAAIPRLPRRLKIRVVNLRSGLVPHPGRHGLLARLLPLGPAGLVPPGSHRARRLMTWISLSDEIRAMRFPAV